MKPQPLHALQSLLSAFLSVCGCQRVAARFDPLRGSLQGCDVVQHYSASTAFSQLCGWQAT